MKSYYRCGLFEEQPELTNVFSISQQEIQLKRLLENGKLPFTQKEIVYDCTWKKQENFDNQKPTIIIPVKNNGALLEKTLENIKANNVLEYSNLIVVDDRSEEESVVEVTEEYRLSYLRVENKKGFNFSMLNNIASWVCYKLGCDQVIFWNSDLWVVNEEYFLEFLKRHNENNSTVSGCKLLYPPKEISFVKEDDSQNIKEYYPNMSGKWRNTVQYAGPIWLPVMPRFQVISPLHYKRFASKEDPRVNCDKGTSCLTGALMIVQLEDFIKLGGLNPSLSKNFQDIDFCLRVVENGLSCFYFGKDLFFYHDESISLSGKKKKDKQLLSDEVLFGKIWNDKITQLVL
tara:strand:+ start:1121 stop:2155 length:1035 start_codon:yes stop_codon:yes gene_type:complete